MWTAHFRHALIFSTRYFLCHGFKNGKQFPLVYALLPDKSRQTYSRLLELVKRKTVSLELNLSPSKFLGDFELAIKQAVDLCFPLADFKGCYFHFSQALMRKFQALGLQVACRSDEAFKSILTCNSPSSICSDSLCPISLARNHRLLLQHICTGKFPTSHVDSKYSTNSSIRGRCVGAEALIPCQANRTKRIGTNAKAAVVRKNCFASSSLLYATCSPSAWNFRIKACEKWK